MLCRESAGISVENLDAAIASGSTEGMPEQLAQLDDFLATPPT